MKNIKTQFLNLMRATTGKDVVDQAAIDLLVGLLEQEDMFLGRIPQAKPKIVNIDEGDRNSDWIKYAHVDTEQPVDTTEFVTVAQVIADLQQLDPRKPVIVQLDGAGNRYKPLAGHYDNARYNRQTGRAGIDQLTDALRVKGFSEADTESGIPCIVLY